MSNQSAIFGGSRQVEYCKPHVYLSQSSTVLTIIGACQSKGKKITTSKHGDVQNNQIDRKKTSPNSCRTTDPTIPSTCACRPVPHFPSV